MQLFKKSQQEEKKKGTSSPIQQVKVKPVDDVLEAIDEEIEELQQEEEKYEDSSRCGCW